LLYLQCIRFDIGGFPTIKFFPPGNKSVEAAEDYDGERTAEALIGFATERLEKYGFASISQIVSQSQLQENCIDKTVACILVFLPNIYDSSALSRNGYIKELSDVNCIF